ncbi:CCA tRNA nucleotidyltransferase [Campylobacter sp. CCS1377]|uniref:CCA tRNA nucleotidyltransferase n=1 Tax=Campylobacter sp. CCS1377 TaxID=3158229 RepID=A0AAU7E6M8_9BACT
MQISKIDLKNNIELAFIADFLKPYTKRAYLVGGSVRDLLLGLDIHDYDIEIYDIEPLKFEKIMQKLCAQGFGKSFFVYKYKNYDLALARTESKTTLGHRGFEVKLCHDEKIAAKRRDFTINACMINLFNNEFLDFYDGIYDLNHKIIRHIDDESFQEDSLRILRAIVFASRFDFRIADESLKLMQKMDISDLSLDRINTELYKFFKTKHLNLGYEYLQKLNLDEKIFGFHFINDEFQNLLKKAQEKINDEALFLYLYLNFFQIDQREFFLKTKLKKNLLRSSMQAYFQDEIDDFEMMEIALEMPLKNWLGLWSNLRIEQAKRLKIYDQKFKIQINSDLLTKQSLKGNDLAIKIKELKKEQIQNYLNKEEK